MQANLIWASFSFLNFSVFINNFLVLILTASQLMRARTWFASITIDQPNQASVDSLFHGRAPEEPLRNANEYWWPGRPKTRRARAESAWIAIRKPGVPQRPASNKGDDSARSF